MLGTLRKLKLDTLIAPEPSEERNRVVAMIVARILDPRSKLATARGLDEETSTSTLAEMLEVQETDAHASSCNVPSRRLRDFTIIPF